ncbi:MAG TPA: IPExxxVDY family protein [Bacteroidales bacterium]|nr:IPExxxVDY family protein [Bacteroidales bacterium]HPS27290.1 IPExxxVDY family protein [Bacteroidales bacterium]
MKKKISFVYDLTDEYRIIGICSHLKEYKFCWYLNKVLNCNLVKKEDFSFAGRNPVPANFSIYYYNDQNQRNQIFLLANKSDNAVLLEKVPEADLLLVIKGLFPDNKTEELISSLKKISNVLTVFSVDMARIKEINTFLTEVELQQMKFEEKPKKIRR